MPDQGDIAEHWLPPSPHREAVLDFLSDGRAHVVERGHRVPPLLVFEDGGAIELPHARYQFTRRGWCLVAADEATASDCTHFYDVCGCIEEFKGRLAEAERLAESERAYLKGLLDDACGMIRRMHRRRQEYAQFATRLAELAARLSAQVEAPGFDLARAYDSAGALHDLLAEDAPLDDARRAQADALAEAVRAVAQASEDALSAGKRTALAVMAEYEAVRGGRAWHAAER